MNKFKDIQINQFQLARLLNNEQMSLLKSILADNVFCTHCGGTCKKGISVAAYFLTSLSDIKINGTCNTCNGDVTRILEFGVDKLFHDVVTDFRKSDDKK